MCIRDSCMDNSRVKDGQTVKHRINKASSWTKSGLVTDARDGLCSERDVWGHVLSTLLDIVFIFVVRRVLSRPLTVTSAFLFKLTSCFIDCHRTYGLIITWMTSLLRLNQWYLRWLFYTWRVINRASRSLHLLLFLRLLILLPMCVCVCVRCV